jgi:hypothetical protein
MMEPKWPEDGSVFISHYEYNCGDGLGPMSIDFADVVHFRHGMNPRNTRLGLSPLDGAIREIFVDLESSNFVQPPAQHGCAWRRDQPQGRGDGIE